MMSGDKYFPIKENQYDNYSRDDLSSASMALGGVLSRDSDDKDEIVGLGTAVKIIASQLEDALLDIPDEVEDRVKRALAEPDTREAEIAQSVARTGRRMCSGTQTPGSFAVVDVINRRLELAVVGLGAVGRWLENV